MLAGLPKVVSGGGVSSQPQPIGESPQIVAVGIIFHIAQLLCGYGDPESFGLIEVLQPSGKGRPQSGRDRVHTRLLHGKSQPMLLPWETQGCVPVAQLS